MEKKKILIVDDEFDLTMLMEHIFLSTGMYDVVIANNGKEAQEKVIQEKPDLIFLDYIMPEVRGDEVLKFVRSQPGFEETPIVIMSGLGGTVFFKGDEEQETFQSDLNDELEDLIGESSSVAFPRNLMEKYKVTATLPKPFSSQSLRYLVKRIFEKAEEKDSSE